jgi:hypothetical protein
MATKLKYEKVTKKITNCNINEKKSG